MRGLEDIFQAIHLLPPWAATLCSVLLAIAAFMIVFRRLTMRRIQNAVRRRVRGDERTRQQMAQQALALAGDRFALLSLLASEALRRQQMGLAKEALQRLEQTSKGKAEAKRLRNARKRVRTPATHPIEVCQNVESLLKQGMHDAARKRLQEGLERWPDDADLLSLSDRAMQPDETETPDEETS